MKNRKKAPYYWIHRIEAFKIFAGSHFWLKIYVKNMFNSITGWKYALFRMITVDFWPGKICGLI